MISDQAIKQAILGKDIEQKIWDCTQAWEGACNDAVEEMVKQQKLEDDAKAARDQFVTCLIGNLAWAATVFFPPAITLGFTQDLFAAGKYVAPHAYEIQGASAATKIVSVLGATTGSGTYNYYYPTPATSSLDWATIKHVLAKVEPTFRDELVKASFAWRDAYLVNHMIAMFSLSAKPNPNRSNDEDFIDWCNNRAGDELRKTVWEKFVFPIDQIPYRAGKEGLKVFLLAKLTDLKTKYDIQFGQWKRFRDQAMLGSRVRWETGYVLNIPPFHFNVRIDGLPPAFLKGQDARLRQLEFQIAAHAR
jgi:hypothetical protein